MQVKLSPFALRWAICAWLVGSLLLVACGDTATTAPTTTSASTTTTNATTNAAGTTSAAATTTNAVGTTSAAATTTSAAGTTGGVKLNTNVSGNVNFWHIWSSPIRRNAIKRVIAICQKQLPNIHVTDTFKPFGDIWTANNAAVAAGSGMPDVIVEDRPQLPKAAANNIESSLQKYATRDGVDGSTFWPFTWKETLYNNETYGIPYETDVQVMYYNKTAFKDAGLDPEKPPKTWDEMFKAADKLDKKNADGTYSQIAFFPLIKGGWDLWSLTNGANIVSPDGSKVSVNDPKVVEAFTWIKKWFDRYGGFSAYNKFNGNFGQAPNDAFMSGKVAMYTDINGYSSSLNAFRPSYKDASGKSANLDWGVTDIPNNGTPASSSGGFALSIPRGAKNADAAWEFIKCATGPEAQASWGRDVYSMPANMIAAKDPTLTADPNWGVFLNAMTYTKILPFVPGYSNFKEQITKRQEDIWQGKTDPKTAMDQAQQAIDTEIAKNK